MPQGCKEFSGPLGNCLHVVVDHTAIPSALMRRSRLTLVEVEVAGLLAPVGFVVIILKVRCCALNCCCAALSCCSTLRGLPRVVCPYILSRLFWRPVCLQPGRFGMEAVIILGILSELTVELDGFSLSFQPVGPKHKTGNSAHFGSTVMRCQKEAMVVVETRERE